MHTATSTTAASEKGRAQTRWQDIRRLEEILGGEFVLDVCAEAETAKAPVWFGPGGVAEDAMVVMDWSYWLGAPLRYSRPLIYCNPPFRRIGDWLKRCVSYRDRITVVGCCPLDPSTRWWSEWVEKANYIIMPEVDGWGSRRTFLKPDGSEFASVDERSGKRKLSSPSGSVVWVVWGMPITWQPQYFRAEFPRIERNL
jgi:hypothetical protein